MIEIRHKRTNALLFSGESLSVRELLESAVLAKANLEGAYLGGANLAKADLGGAYLGGADLGGADLGGAYLGGAYLGGANLGGANLGGANLGGANLAKAYLGGANLGGANLGGANLGGANLQELQKTRQERMHAYRVNNPSVPVVENLDAKILAIIDNGGGELDMSAWHSCETTHCRAGWAIHLAGEAGYALEKTLGVPQEAGTAIYKASTGRVPYFFAANEKALKDIRRCAEEDAK